MNADQDSLPWVISIQRGLDEAPTQSISVSPSLALCSRPYYKQNINSWFLICEHWARLSAWCYHYSNSAGSVKLQHNLSQSAGAAHCSVLYSRHVVNFLIFRMTKFIVRLSTVISSCRIVKYINLLEYNCFHKINTISFYVAF